MSWTQKYAPQTIDEVIGQKKGVDQFLIWLRKWKPGDKAVLIHGPAGVGKTCLIEALGKEKKYEIVELNASDYRTASQIKEVIGKSMKQQSLFMKKKIFLIDEIDGLAGRQDRGGASEIMKIVDETKFPVVLTANDPWTVKLMSLRNNCQLIQFGKVNYWDVIKRLEYICEKERMKCNKEFLKQIAKKSRGDLRSAITDLEILSTKKEITQEDINNLGEREKDENIFDALKMIFKTRTALSAKLSLQNVDKDPEEIFWWIEENILNEYEKPEEIIKAFEMLSIADLFKTRIRSRQEWKFRKYMIDMMTGGIAISKKEMYRKFSRYQYPSMIKSLSFSKIQRAKEKEKLLRISKKLHCSTKKIKQEYLPYFKVEELETLT